MATTAKNNTLTNQEQYELTLLQMERAAGGKRPKPTDGIVDFFIWAACGFHHRYAPTGKTKTDIDLVFPVKFYQVKCIDCGHISWERGEAPNIQGPKINPDAINPPQ